MRKYNTNQNIQTSIQILKRSGKFRWPGVTGAHHGPGNGDVTPGGFIGNGESGVDGIDR